MTDRINPSLGHVPHHASTESPQLSRKQLYIIEQSGVVARKNLGNYEQINECLRQRLSKEKQGEETGLTLSYGGGLRSVSANASYPEVKRASERVLDNLDNDTRFKEALQKQRRGSF